MSQKTLDSNTAPEGSAGDQPSSKQPAPRRRRRPASHAAAAAAAPVQPAAEAAATPAPAPAPVASPAPAHEPTAAPEASAASAASPAQPAERARRQPSTRPRSRRAASRKNDVQLVIPPAPPAQQNGAHAPTPETKSATGDQTLGTELGTEAEPRVVPVVTEPGALVSGPAGAQPVEPLTLEPATTSESRPQAPVLSRYRFGRRTAPFAPEQSMRPERLSGVSSSATVPAASAAAEAEPVSAVRDDIVSELSASTPAAGPGAGTDTAVPTPTQPAKPARDALDDIVAALGLRDAASAPAAGESTAEAAPDVEAEEAEGESEAAAADEAETQTGARRRRRRRRSGSSHTGAAEDEAAEQTEAPEGVSVLPYDAPESERDDRNGFERYGGTSYAYPEQAPYSPYSRPSRDHGQAERQPWDIGAGEQQIRQPQSPFGAPEPSFARGFGPQPRGVAGPARETYPRTGRSERTDIPPMSPNVLASTVTNAIQQQTDRLLSELRHQANPPAMSIMLPPFPSTERIGVFVDVANLLYSARSLRVSIDFGRLLDFLRGNRRLVRAHAYAPTNPDPHAEQSFLTAVKGLGYRITTKNYKTFSSGAKKADMDLDLCMDIVRMVDARAIDTVVLVSGDSDFLPLLEYCSDRGVRVEVAAFDDSAAMILRQSCDLFINLSLVDDIRA